MVSVAGLVVVGLAPLVAAALAARRVTQGVPGPSRRLGTVGVLSGGVGFALTALLGLITGDPTGTSSSNLQLLPLSAGVTVGSVLLLGALLGMASGGDRAALWHGLLDGALVGASGYYVLWELVIEPEHREYLDGPVKRFAGDCVVLAQPVVALLLVAGTALVLVLRAGAGRAQLLRAGAAVVTAALLGAGSVYAIRYAGAATVIACGLGYGTVLLGIGYLAPRLARLPRPAPDPTRRPSLLIGLIPVAVALVACAIRRGVWGPLDAVGLSTMLGIALLVTVRQAATVVELRRVLREYRHQALTDPLTGLPNRRQLLAVLGAAQPDAQPDAQPASLILLDLDGFKAVNDIHGHDAGDSVLVEVARRLRAALPADGFVARLGGDEFAVLLPTGLAEAVPVAAGLRSALEQPYRIGTAQVYLSGSFGLAGRGAPGGAPNRGAITEPGAPNRAGAAEAGAQGGAGEPGADGGAGAPGLAGMLVNADVALRFAKQRGKNRVENYAVADAVWLRRRTRVEQELRGAIERGELSLVFQPVMQLPAGRPVGVETLLRWHHPELGAVPPDEFIPIAEEVGLVSALDRWVLHQACHQLATWVADGYDLWVAVNISVRDLQQAGYVSRVLGLLEDHDLPPSLLVLEVTEHAVALDPEEVSQRLSELRALGVRVALDDFGAGYSSLGQLRTLPVDIVKIDRALLVDPLLDISVQLAQRLGKLVVAEGIADEESRAAVQRTACPLGQGSALCPPLPAKQVTALLSPARAVPAQRRAQHAGQVDSSHEMRQS